MNPHKKNIELTGSLIYTPPTAASVRKFRTEKVAQRYLDDNAQFFAKIAFQIEHIQNGGGAI